MALLASEVQRIKIELGYHGLSYGAEPYIGVAALFEQVIQPYLLAGASTVSTTAVDDSAVPGVISLVLASSTGFAAGARVVVDVDALQEVVTVRSVSDSVISVYLTLAHAGGYPVTVEGPESLVREKLQAIRRLQGLMAKSRGLGTLRKADEVEFYQTSRNGQSQFDAQSEELEWWRDELARALGVRRLNGSQRSGGGLLAVLY